MDENKITLRQLRALARALRATTLNRIELKGERWSVRMTCSPAPTSVATPAATAICTSLCAPAPGQILLRHPLLAQDFAQVGSHVAQHQILALVKVGALYLPLRSPASGTFISCAITHEDAVEFGEEILKIQQDEVTAAGL